MVQGRGILETEITHTMDRTGDRNTMYFNQSTVEMRIKNNICRMQRMDWIWVENEEDIMKECEHYFHEIFKTEGSERI